MEVATVKPFWNRGMNNTAKLTNMVIADEIWWEKVRSGCDHIGDVADFKN